MTPKGRKERLGLLEAPGVVAVTRGRGSRLNFPGSKHNWRFIKHQGGVNRKVRGSMKGRGILAGQTQQRLAEGRSGRVECQGREFSGRILISTELNGSWSEPKVRDPQKQSPGKETFYQCFGLIFLSDLWCPSILPYSLIFSSKWTAKDFPLSPSLPPTLSWLCPGCFFLLKCHPFPSFPWHGDLW